MAARETVTGMSVRSITACAIEGLQPAQPRGVAADAHHHLVHLLALGHHSDTLGRLPDLSNSETECCAPRAARWRAPWWRGCVGAQPIARGAARELADVAVEGCTFIRSTSSFTPERASSSR